VSNQICHLTLRFPRCHTNYYCRSQSRMLYRELGVVQELVQELVQGVPL